MVWFGLMRLTMFPLTTTPRPSLKASSLFAGGLIVVLFLTTVFAQTDSDTYARQIAKLKSDARAGDAAAQFSLASAYDSGHGVRRDLLTAARWYAEAANRGHIEALFSQAALAEEGVVPPNGISDPVELYERAAQSGHAGAANNLGRLYAEGIKVDRNYQKAANWFSLAANQDHAESCYNLGVLHEHGLIPEADPEKARAWYRCAASDYAPARAALERLTATMKPGDTQ